MLLPWFPLSATLCHGAQRIESALRAGFSLLDAGATALDENDQHDDEQNASGDADQSGAFHEILPFLFEERFERISHHDDCGSQNHDKQRWEDEEYERKEQLD